MDSQELPRVICFKCTLFVHTVKKKEQKKNFGGVLTHICSLLFFVGIIHCHDHDGQAAA